MAKLEKVYWALQKHLDRQPVGYPATNSGVELRLLKQMFTPDEANLALNLSYEPQSTQQIYAAMNNEDKSFEKLENMLHEMTSKFIIHHIMRNGETYFSLIPLIVGMYEGQLKKLTPQFIKDFDEYTSDKAFGLSFLATELPQMRTIPIEKSITPTHNVTTYDHFESILNNTEGPFVVSECICRKSKDMKETPCQKTERTETCLAVGEMANICLKADWGRQIEKEEAFSIMRANQADGLVLQPNNAQKMEFICACCGCCCGMLNVHKMLPKPLDFWASNFYAAINSEDCTSCGTCVDSCEVNAVDFDGEESLATVNLDRCIGCGNCVPTCPGEAIQLQKKDLEITPPTTQEDLYNIIMEKKKGAFGKFKLAMKLMRQN